MDEYEGKFLMQFPAYFVLNSHNGKRHVVGAKAGESGVFTVFTDMDQAIKFAERDLSVEGRTDIACIPDARSLADLMVNGIGVSESDIMAIDPGVATTLVFRVSDVLRVIRETYNAA